MLKSLAIYVGLIPVLAQAQAQAQAQAEPTLLARSTQIIEELAKELKFSAYESTVLYIRNDILHGKLRRLEAQINESATKRLQADAELIVLSPRDPVAYRRAASETLPNNLDQSLSSLEQKLRVLKERIKKPLGVAAQ